MAEYRIPQAVAIARKARARTWRLDARAAIYAAGFASSLLLAVLLVFSVLVYDESPWKLLRMAAAVAGGPAMLAPEGHFDPRVVGAGLSMHLALGALFALAFLGVTAEAPAAALPAAGLAYGAALYFAVFHGFAMARPWLAEMRTPDTFMAFAAFGLAAALLYQSFTPPPRRRR